MASDSESGESVTRSRGRHSVMLTPAAWQTAEDIEADFAGSFKFGDRMIERGVQEHHSRFRRIGPVKVMRAKEVGPPPWRWPKVVAGCLRDPLFLSIGVGWRSTLYSFHVMWCGSKIDGLPARESGADGVTAAPRPEAGGAGSTPAEHQHDSDGNATPDSD